MLLFLLFTVPRATVTHFTDDTPRLACVLHVLESHGRERRQPDRNRAPGSYLEEQSRELQLGLRLLTSRKRTRPVFTPFVSRRAFQPGEEPPSRKMPPNTQDPPKHSRGTGSQGRSGGGFGSVTERQQPALHSQREARQSTAWTPPRRPGSGPPGGPQASARRSAPACSRESGFPKTVGSKSQHLPAGSLDPGVR